MLLTQTVTFSFSLVWDELRLRCWAIAFCGLLVLIPLLHKVCRAGPGPDRGQCLPGLSESQVWASWANSGFWLGEATTPHIQQGGEPTAHKTQGKRTKRDIEVSITQREFLCSLADRSSDAGLLGQTLASNHRSVPPRYSVTSAGSGETW